MPRVRWRDEAGFHRRRGGSLCGPLLPSAWSFAPGTVARPSEGRAGNLGICNVARTAPTCQETVGYSTFGERVVVAGRRGQAARRLQSWVAPSLGEHTGAQIPEMHETLSMAC